MASRSPSGLHTRRHAKSASPVSRAVWKLEDAKARFSELVRLARAEGPQRVTVRGQDAVVIVAAEAFERMLPAALPRQDLASFLQSLDIGELDVSREHDVGRDIPL